MASADLLSCFTRTEYHQFAMLLVYGLLDQKQLVGQPDRTMTELASAVTCS